MYLNLYQQYIAELISEYGSLSKNQLLAMINCKSQWPKSNIDGYIEQMCRFGDYAEMPMRDKSIVYRKGGVIDYDIIRSFDVMVAFLPAVVHHHKSKDNISIIFTISTEQHEKDIFVIPVKLGDERRISIYVNDKFENHKSEVVIFLLEEEKQMQNICADCNHRYAIITKDGVKFMKGKTIHKNEEVNQ